MKKNRRSERRDYQPRSITISDVAVVYDERSMEEAEDKLEGEE